MERFSGQTFAVIGLGKSGLSAARMLLARGAVVHGYDDSAEAAEKLTHPSFSYAGPTDSNEFWKGVSTVIVSPGVPLARLPVTAILSAGVRLWGEIELAFRARPLGAGPLIGITGTNGKSTTTALTGELLRARSPRTFVGGNLGLPFSAAYEDPTTPPYDFHVVELSSFQLESLDATVCHGAALLNVTPDHVDRYPNFDAYVATKGRIFARQSADDYAVVNLDDPWSEAAARTPAALLGFSSTTTYKRGLRRFTGIAAPTRDGFSVDFDSFDSLMRFTLNSRALRGRHNLENAMAATLIALREGVQRDVIQQVLDTFPGLPHRLESVRELDGVEWLNDSKATNVDSTLVALKALTPPLWLIAGGRGKHAPYEPLAALAPGRLNGVFTIGEDAPAIAAAFKELVPVHDCGTLEVAIAECQKRAAPGDKVLLSPACASYDQFRSFEHRGERFKELVMELQSKGNP